MDARLPGRGGQLGHLGRRRRGRQDLQRGRVAHVVLHLEGARAQLAAVARERRAQLEEEARGHHALGGQDVADLLGAPTLAGMTTVDVPVWLGLKGLIDRDGEVDRGQRRRRGWPARRCARSSAARPRALGRGRLARAGSARRGRGRATAALAVRSLWATRRVPSGISAGSSSSSSLVVATVRPGRRQTERPRTPSASGRPDAARAPGAPLRAPRRCARPQPRRDLLAGQPVAEQVRGGARILVGATAVALGQTGGEALVVELDRDGDRAAAAAARTRASRASDRCRRPTATAAGRRPRARPRSPARARAGGRSRGASRAGRRDRSASRALPSGRSAHTRNGQRRSRAQARA